MWTSVNPCLLASPHRVLADLGNLAAVVGRCTFIPD
jgi:hypothetical protein